MKTEIDILTYEEWLKANIDKDPRINEKALSAYNCYYKSYSVGRPICEIHDLTDNLTGFNPEEMLKFVEKIKSYILENEPDTINFRQCDHILEANAIFENDLSGVDAYLKYLYHRYKRDIVQTTFGYMG